MKTNSLFVAILVAAAGLWVTQSAKADVTYPAGVEIRSVSDFYEPLALHGYWIETSRYGWCWYPADVDRGWQPYRDGHWVWCDQGWYWESDEPWAWATYHYGHWTWDSYYGWVWAPDVIWAPSWVCWREGGGYVGWAPLPPQYDYEPSYNVVVIAPQYFIFVEHHHFCEPIRPSILVVNQTVINQTVNITKFGKGSQVIINQGPSLAVIERNNPGRVVKVKVEHRLPAEVQQARQEWRGAGLAQRPVPPIIRGTRWNADASTVARPMAPHAGDHQRQPDVEPVPKGDRRQGKRSASQPPATVVAQSIAQPLPPSAATPVQSENDRDRKLGHHKHSDDTGTLNSQGR